MAKRKQWNEMNRKEKTSGIVVLCVIGFVILLIVGANIHKPTNLNSQQTANTQAASNQSSSTADDSSSSASSSSTPAATTPTPAPAKAATPAPAPAAPKTLLTLSGNGIENSAPFMVTQSKLTVIYSYDCSSQDGSGNFIADLEYGNQSSLNSDDQSIANALSSGATNVTTTIYPQDPGHDYYLAVNSECNWTVTVNA
jgi:hypothetical protein